MMGVFDEITKRIPPLQEYLNFVFENKQGSLVGSRKEEDKVLSWNLLLSELFNPTCKDIVNTNSFRIEPHAKQRQYSELSSGTSARPQLSTYLQ